MRRYRKKTKLGKLILATNDLELTLDRLLKYYKEHETLKGGFSSLKTRAPGYMIYT